MKVIFVLVLMLVLATPAQAGWFCDREPPKRERVVEIRPADVNKEKPLLKIFTVGASLLVGVIKIAVLVVP